jgi:type I restriction enzyme R subunit
LTGNFGPRYYQEIAVNKVMESISDGQNRILLTLATGTGKTFISFQIVHKLLKAKWNLDGNDRRPRVLFLADRNVLADQAINTFNPYEKDVIKIDGEEVRKRNGVVPTNAYIFFAIYQAIAEREDIGGYYKEYPSDFFDLIVIDECHRGSANEEGSWRAILDHFKPAIHLGLTATPKRDDNVDTYKYFGKPVYEYSLKEGIQDGFLTP